MSSLYHKYWSIFFILLLAPLLLLAALTVLPTFDDWASLTRPTFEPLFIKERWLFYGYHWRPFDSVIGYILGLNPQLLFPTLNHCLVILGHVGCSLLIFRILTELVFQQTAKNIATLFFFIAPATMATVLAVDSMNQTYALLWGMVAFLLYIKLKKFKYFVWIPLIFIATLCKENGLMWALICPVLAFGFNLIEKRTLKKDLAIAIVVIIGYALAILLFPKEIIIHPEYEPGMLKVVNNVIKFVFTTFFTFDYVYLLHLPSRNLLLAGISLLLTLPFCFYIYVHRLSFYAEKKMICTVICMLIAVGPHILTIFSMMHIYAGLPFLCIIIANAIHHKNNRKPIILTFIVWIIAALCIDTHLWNESMKSGLIGKEMAQEAVRKTGKPVKSVYVIIIEDDYPKLSSFCVIPNEAFGWGLAAQYETNYEWPETIQDTTIERSDEAINTARQIGNEVLRNKTFECVWIVDRQNIDVIK